MKNADFMNAVGIICEYNPLHEGHTRHMRLAREGSGADTLVCVMSGALVQRGQPAVLDAFTRAEWAICSGADLVLLLPAVYSCASADDFARGGMRVLKDSGIVSSFSFGCRSENPAPLFSAAKLLSCPSDDFSAALRSAVAQGMGYPAALGLAARRFCPNDIDPAALDAVFQSANDTLGMRYLIENEALGAHLRPIPVHRPAQSVTASDLRAALSGTLSKEESQISGVSEFVRSDLIRKKHCDPAFFETILAAHLRLMEKDALDSIYGMTPTLRDGLFSAARQCVDAQQIESCVSGRHFTRARVRRALWHCLLGVTDTLAQEARKTTPYLRVLAVRQGREDLLGALHRNAQAPVLTSGKIDELSSFAQQCAALDMRAMDLQAMTLDDPRCGAWFTKKLIKI